MQTPNKLLDDCAKVITTLIRLAVETRREGRAALQEGVKRIARRLNLVEQEDLEVVRSMATEARIRQEAIEGRLDQMAKEIENSKI